MRGDLRLWNFGISNDYSAAAEKITLSVEERIQHLAKLAEQLKHPDAGAAMTERNHFTRLVDASIEWAREHFPAIHKLGAWMLAVFMYLYVRLLGSTIRLVELNHRTWPEVATPCVLAFWHGSAPSFLAAIARLRPRIPMVIMVSPNPRGDSLAVMFRWLGVEVVRGDHAHAGRQALIQLAHELEKGKCTLLTVDGGGTAKFAKPGAVMLSVA